MKNKSNLPLIVDAMLAEYNVHTTEIQNRSASENTYIQYHIGALTGMLGGIALDYLVFNTFALPSIITIALSFVLIIFSLEFITFLTVY